jgi:hypothetical protein
MKTDDSSLDEIDHRNIRNHARRVLQGASAIGCFPTPVDAVMEYAKVVVADADALDEGYLRKIRKSFTGALKRAISKVRGVLDVVGRLIYLDRTLYVARRTFLKLHETAHAVLPHQCKLYACVEDCEKTIAPDVSEQFDREANVFATEVLFQLDSFADDAREAAFGILVPVRLSKKYGASIYASIRRYVSTNLRTCSVLVLEPPELLVGLGFSAKLRRVVSSPEFNRQFGAIQWPDTFCPSDQIGAAVPIAGRKMSRPRNIVLVDQNGTRHECIAEAFTQKHQVFVLIHAVTTLTKKTIVLA